MCANVCMHNILSTKLHTRIPAATHIVSNLWAELLKHVAIDPHDDQERIDLSKDGVVRQNPYST